MTLTFAMMAAFVPGVSATTLSFVGNLGADATVTGCGMGCVLGDGTTDSDYAQWAAVVYSFTVTTTSTMQAQTFSYGGGSNGAGTTILPGGFEPYLSLFDAGGNFLSSTYFGQTCPSSSIPNAATAQCYDVQLDGGILAPGIYQIAITTFANMSLAENNGTGTLADGFTGLGNLADGEDLHYAFDVKLTPTIPLTNVPEPRGEGLAGAALVIAVLACRYRRRRESIRMSAR